METGKMPLRTYNEIYREQDAAFDWRPDDPRLPGVADRARRWLATRPAEDHAPDTDLAIARLAVQSMTPSSPAWRKLAELGG